MAKRASQRGKVSKSVRYVIRVKGHATYKEIAQFMLDQGINAEVAIDGQSITRPCLDNEEPT
jgi:hypothetical protein